MKKTVTQGSTVTTTEYREGFQYLGGVLQFIQHAEGYVNYLNSGGGKYNYVFNYLDHLGNVRASFAKDPATGLPKILKENHYSVVVGVFTDNNPDLHNNAYIFKNL